MHSRHRSPGGGGGGFSRSNNNNNSMGMGGGGLVTGRISPEMYNSGYNRNFNNNNNNNNNNNRSFNGRMVSNNNNNNNRPYQPALPPQQQVRRSSGDILMEAGRLAAEYLVSQGVLPPNVLTEKWGNGNMLGGDGRGSVLNRLGNGGSDFGGGGGSGGRRMRGRRKTGFSSTRGFDSEWGRDVRNNNDQMSPNMEYGDDSVSGQWHHEERQGDFDGTSGVSKPGSNDLPLTSDVVGNLEMEVDKSEVPDDAGSKGSTSTTGKEVPCETDHRFSNASDDVNILNTETGETKDAVINDGLEKQTASEDFSVDHLSKEDDTSKNSNDLLQLGSSAKVSTKAGSSLAVKDSNVEPVTMAGEFQACDISTTKGPKVSTGEDPTEETKHLSETKRFDSDDSKAPLVQTMEDVGVLGSALETERGDGVMSRSLLDRSVMYGQESGQNLFELGSSNSVVKDRGEKRVLEDEDIREGSKKAREWSSTEVSRPNDYLQLHNFGANPSDLHRSSTPDLEVVEFVDQERLFDVALLPRGAPESGTEPKEEKQLFPSSFKICDLNLMESSDMTETHDGRPLFGLSSTMEAKKGLQVDVDLSMSNGCQRSDNYDGGAADAKKPIIVEVEDDSPKEHEVFDHSERKTDIAHSSLDGFPNHMDDTGDLPDAQDGYGLMISELLGNDISNCSSVPADMTSMHNEMGLHNAVEILDDDDPIYLSLGEIPISFLGVWEQPTQPFGKPF